MNSPRKNIPSSETVTAGRETIGKVISLERGHEAFSIQSGYLATYPSLAEARKAVFESFNSVRKEAS